MTTGLVQHITVEESNSIQWDNGCVNSIDPEYTAHMLVVFTMFPFLDIYSDSPDLAISQDP